MKAPAYMKTVSNYLACNVVGNDCKQFCQIDNDICGSSKSIMAILFRSTGLVKNLLLEQIAMKIRQRSEPELKKQLYKKCWELQWQYYRDPSFDPLKDSIYSPFCEDSVNVIGDNIIGNLMSISSKQEICVRCRIDSDVCSSGKSTEFNLKRQLERKKFEKKDTKKIIEKIALEIKNRGGI